jgi:superfamily II DNA or RNA helicase
VNRYGAPRDWGRLSQALQAWSGQQYANPTRCRLARAYLKMFNQRRETLAGAQAKLDALAALAPTIGAASRALVFCQTVESAQSAAAVLQDQRLDARPYVGGLSPAARRALLGGFQQGSPQCLCAPRVLDEGIDVPAADLGVIVAASMSERQMIQRMGRVLRPKDDGRPARFLVLYVQGTMEDPRRGAHEGFLGRILEVATRVQFLPAELLPIGEPLQLSEPR